MYTHEQIDKIGNTIIYFTSKISDASKTKLIKLLYILDELSIKKSGIPFLNLDYKVWKFGPVPVDIFVELSASPVLLKDFIKRDCICEHDYFSPKKDFCDDEFTQMDLELMDFVIERFKDQPTSELIKYTHRANSPWYNAAKRNSVLELLEGERLSNTPFDVNLEELISYDEIKLHIYRNYKEHANNINEYANIL